MITYIPLAMIIGIPLTFMELGISQFSRTSNISWNLCPLFRGIGYSKITLALIFQIYYNVLNSYVFLYLITSLSTTVKWARCDPSWANSSCYDFQEDRWTKNDSGYQTSVEQFWYNKVLVIQETTEKFDWPQWELVAYLSVTMFILTLGEQDL
ncbi:hypothetical protein NQ317_010063 [Molorchus minor]|uniref:Uncharacterized protein n=1 Tax=Molorchus minor TaxID=1323400 RepID=A0ABQ9JMY0_9CUCU|nr:hypothetical protein NQ317_010063 [Molorchus minor]